MWAALTALVSVAQASSMDFVRAGVFDTDSGVQLAELSSTKVYSMPASIELRIHDGARPCIGRYTLSVQGGAALDGRAQERPAELVMPRSGRRAFINPSLLAADIGSLSLAAQQVAASGAEWVHVDINDGSAICQRSLSSLGPASIAAVRKAAPQLKVDVHLYTLDPEAQVAAVASAGAHRIVFQWEALLEAPRGGGRGPAGGGMPHDQTGEPVTAAEAAEGALVRARALITTIRSAGCAAGVCLAPETPAAVLDPLCAEGELDLINVLSVLPGIGGQAFRSEVLEKVRWLRREHPALPYIMVDGGIDGTTAPLAAAAGANALVSGSYLFRAPPGRMAERVAVLRQALMEHGE